jgi:tRNA dimethylallyltransferase
MEVDFQFRARELFSSLMIMPNRNFIQNISQWNLDRILSVVGPTGSGKTSTVLNFVKSVFPDPRVPLLVSVDSVAVFQEISIGTSKPMGIERDPFDWAGLDLFSVSFKPSAKDYYEKVWPKIQQTASENRPIVLVGGSHFYEKVLVEGFRPGTESDEDYIFSLKEYSSLHLWENLKKQDPRWGSSLHINDRYRLERYSDLVIRQGLTYDSLKGLGQSANIGGVGSLQINTIDTLVLGLNCPPDVTESLLKDRIIQMLEQGWIEECQRLLFEGLSPDCPGFQSVGYREVVEFLLAGKVQSRDFLTKEILISHRQLAKKQRTWLRGLLNQGM